jgi:PAS domain S-box-containing protein
VLEHVDDGVFLVDERGVIRHWNPAAHAITGLSEEAVLDRRAEEALPGWDTVGSLIPIAALPGPGSRSAKTVPLELGGRELWLSISGVKFADGVVYAFRNLTEERALDELKGEFVATVSHEIRTPLAAIYGSAQTLRRKDLALDDERRESLLDVITHESERLTRIAGDILLANTLDSDRLRLERVPVDLDVLTRDVVDEMRTCFAQRDDISIHFSSRALDAPVAGDSDKLRQILMNLIENAVKYSPDGGRIEVELEASDNRVRVVVRDEGIGIPPGEEQRIFAKFYRVDPQLSRGVGGTGLGLYISRELVRRMQGRVSVAPHEGRGATFLVDLPLAPAAALSETA